MKTSNLKFTLSIIATLLAITAILQACKKDVLTSYAAQETTISVNQNITLTLAETTEADIQQAINNLNTY